MGKKESLLGTYPRFDIPEWHNLNNRQKYKHAIQQRSLISKNGMNLSKSRSKSCEFDK
jgi:hypothetical protein